MAQPPVQPPHVLHGAQTYPQHPQHPHPQNHPQHPQQEYMAMAQHMYMQPQGYITYPPAQFPPYPQAFANMPHPHFAAAEHPANFVQQAIPPIHAPLIQQQSQAAPRVRSRALPVDPPAKPRPNQEINPGVFRFQVEVVENLAKREFTAETDMPWDMFRRYVVGLLENRDVELTSKVSGDSGRATHLATQVDFDAMMERVRQRCLTARSRPVALEIKNIAKPPPSKKPVSKRRRDEDVPPESTPELNTQLAAYKKLEAVLHCETHRGHCFIDRTAGRDNHRRLSHAEMSLWAKKMSLGEATKYNPPHCINFDRPATKKPRRSGSLPEVHVTIQNITSENSSGPSTAHVVQPLPISGPPTPTTPTFDFLPPAFPWDISTVTTHPPIDDDCSPIVPGDSSEPRPSGSSSEMHGGSATSTEKGTDWMFPSIKTVVEKLIESSPRGGFDNLCNALSESGITESTQILLVPEDVLCVAAAINPQQAVTLRNHTRRMILPLLGLKGNYDEHVPEAEIENNNEEDDNEDDDDDVSDSGNNNNNNETW